MNEGYQILSEIGLIIFVSMLFGAFFEQLGLSSIVGYALAGLFLGPAGINIVHSVEVISIFSQLGILLLLFFIGLEISVKQFKKAGFFSIFLSPVKSGLGFALGYIIARLFGLTPLEGMVAGAMLAVSSTGIISQMIIERHWQKSIEAQISISMLILEDIFSIAFIALLLGMEQGVTFSQFITNSLAILVVLLTLGGILSRKFYEFIHNMGHEDKLGIYAFALLLVFSTIFGFFGVSPELGAFFAGMLLAESAKAKRIERDLEVFRKIFVMIFFTSMGLVYTPELSIRSLLLFLSLFVAHIVQNFVSLVIFGPVFGVPPRNAIRTAILMLPIGEFSLFFAAAAAKLGLPHAGVLMAAAFFLMIFTTALASRTVKRIREIEEWILSHLPPSVIQFIMQLERAYRHAFILPHAVMAPSFQNRLGVRMRRLVLYILGLVFINYLIGFALSQATGEFGKIPLPILIPLVGYLLATIPLYYIIKEVIAMFEHYVELLLSEVVREVSTYEKRYITRRVTLVVVGLILILLGIFAFVTSSEINVLTFYFLSILIATAGLALFLFGASGLLSLFTRRKRYEDITEANRLSL